MATTFYLHAATTTNTGTLPSGKHSTQTDAVTGSPATKNTQRSMDLTIGTSQTSLAATTNASTSAQAILMGMWESPPMAAQTLPTGTWTLSFASSESNTGSNYQTTICLYAWRPGTGAVVGSILYDHLALATEPGTSETAATLVTASVTGIAVNAGDILVLEVWRGSVAQTAATARTNTFFYDGTTNASTTSNAASLTCNGGTITIPANANVNGVAAQVTVAGGTGGYSVLQSNSANASSGNLPCTYLSNVASGTKLVAAVALSTSNAGGVGISTVITVADASSNTATFIGGLFHGSDTYLGLFAMDTPAGDVGTKPTLTATVNASVNNFGIAMVIQEVAGIPAGNTLAAMVDGTLATNSGTTSPATGGSYSSTAANEYLVAVIGDPGSGQTYSNPQGRVDRRPA